MRAVLRASCVVSLVIVVLLSSTTLALAQEGQGASNPTYLPFVSFASSGVSQESVVTHIVPLAEQQAALAYWTHERVSAALASPLPALEASALPREVVEPAAAEELVLVAPGRPAANADQVARAAYPEDWAPKELSVEELDAIDAGLEADMAAMAAAPSSANGTEQIYNSYIANHLSVLQTVPPHRYIGRLVFITPEGEKTCSATALRGNNIVTAGHCVYGVAAQSFYTNKVFTPAYRYGSMPYGTFPITKCYIMPGYVSSTGVGRWDIAVCKAGRNSASQTLNDAVGYSGYALNSGYYRNVVSLGYPVNNNSEELLSWPAEFLRVCAAETFSESTDVRGIGCNWGGGASGGPWIESISLPWPTTYGTNGYAPGRSSGYVTGVNSYIYTFTQNLYGPRFTTTNFRPLCTSAGC